MTTRTGIRAHHFTLGAPACARVRDGKFDSPTTAYSSLISGPG